MNSFRKTFVLVFAACILVMWGGANLPIASVFLVSFSASLAAAAIMKRSVSSRFKELKDAIGRIRNGDYLARLDDVRGNDLNKIAREFNTLAEELSKYRSFAEERKRELRSLIDSIPEGLILLDGDFKAVIANSTLADMFPYFNPEAPVASLSIPSLNSLAQEARDGGKVSEAVLSESGKGSGRSFKFTFIPLEKGRWALSIVDMTIEAKLEKIKSDLVANVSHELRTPLSAFSSLLDVLEGEKDEARKTEFIGRLRNQAEKMTSLLNDLLSLSRLEGGEYEVKKSEINLPRFVADILYSLEPEISRMRSKVETDIPEGLVAKSDANLLEAIVKNVVENAVKYNTEDGKVSIRASMEEGTLLLEIEDSGPGIPEEHRERIYERFFRIDSHRSRVLGGTGLGLSIVKHAVKLLGGALSLESEMGKGSKFIITVPAA